MLIKEGVMTIEELLRRSLFLTEPDYLCSESSVKRYVDESINIFLERIDASSNNYDLIERKVINLSEEQGINLRIYEENPGNIDATLFRYLEALFDEDEFKLILSDYSIKVKGFIRSANPDLVTHYLVIKHFVEKNGNPTKEFNNYINERIRELLG